MPSPPPPAAPLVPSQRIDIAGGTCVVNGQEGPCVAAGTSCGAGFLPVPSSLGGYCPAGGQCCAPNTALCRCNNNSNDIENCGYYQAKQTSTSCMCVPSSGQNYVACKSGCVENGCNSVIGGNAYACVVTCLGQCHVGTPSPANAVCEPQRG